MSAAERDKQDESAEYVLGLLDRVAWEQAERRLAANPAFARDVEEWRQRFSDFDKTVTPEIPNPVLWQRIEASIVTAAPAERRPRDVLRLWNSIPALRAATMGASFVALMLAVGMTLAVREARQQPKLVAVLLDGDRAGAIVNSFSDGRVVLLPLITIDVPEGRALEVWTLPSRERGPVSVGLMQDARTLQLQLKDLPSPGPGQLFEITLEPSAGSPTGRPTGPILFKGNTSLAL